MVAKRTAYNHRELDIKKKLVNEDAVTKANGSLTLVSYGDFFGMFRQYVAGKADENGFPCNPTTMQWTHLRGRTWTVTWGIANIMTVPTCHL